MRKSSGWGVLLAALLLLNGERIVNPDLNAWWDRVLYLYCWALEGAYNPVTIECVTAFVP